MDIDPLDTCPYDKVHRIMRSKMPKHLVKCRRNFPCSEMKTCPYNTTHLCNPIEYDYHVEHCPDSIHILSYTRETDVIPENKLIPIENKYLPVTEDWDNDPPAPNYDPEHNAEKKHVLRQLTCASKSQRKNFRYAERKRLQALEDTTCTEPMPKLVHNAPMRQPKTDKISLKKEDLGVSELILSADTSCTQPTNSKKSNTVNKKCKDKEIKESETQKSNKKLYVCNKGHTTNEVLIKCETNISQSSIDGNKDSNKLSARENNVSKVNVNNEEFDTSSVGGNNVDYANVDEKDKSSSSELNSSRQNTDSEINSESLEHWEVKVSRKKRQYSAFTKKQAFSTSSSSKESETDQKVNKKQVFSTSSSSKESETGQKVTAQHANDRPFNTSMSSNTANQVQETSNNNSVNTPIDTTNILLEIQLRLRNLSILESQIKEEREELINKIEQYKLPISPNAAAAVVTPDIVMQNPRCGANFSNLPSKPELPRTGLGRGMVINSVDKKTANETSSTILRRPRRNPNGNY